MFIFTCLGTSAGELYPGIWCRCDACEAARRAGGPSVRQSACAAIGTVENAEGRPTFDTLIDFPPEIASQAWRWGVDLTAIEHLLVTHSHGDHFLPYLLRWRRRPPQPDPDGRLLSAPRLTPLPTLTVCGNAESEARLQAELGADLSAYDLRWITAVAGHPLALGPMEVLPVAANHDVGRESALNYVVRREGTTVFYGLDGDAPLPEALETIEGIEFDLVLFEATFGDGQGRNHMNFDRLIRVASEFRECGRIREGGAIVASHFSPHHSPPHEAAAERLACHGIIAAYDGWSWRPA